MTDVAEIAAGLTRDTAKSLIRGDWTRRQGDELARAGLIEHVPRHGFRCCNALGLAVRAHLKNKGTDHG